MFKSNMGPKGNSCRFGIADGLLGERFREGKLSPYLLNNSDFTVRRDC